MHIFEYILRSQCKEEESGGDEDGDGSGLQSICTIAIASIPTTACRALVFWTSCIAMVAERDVLTIFAIIAVTGSSSTFALHEHLARNELANLYRTSVVERVARTFAKIFVGTWLQTVAEALVTTKWLAGVDHNCN